MKGLKTLFLLLIFSLLIFLSGCSKPVDKQLLQDVHEKMEQQYNVEFTMTQDMKIDGSQNTIIMDFKMDMESDTVGLVEFTAEGLLDSTSYIEMDGENVITYVNVYGAWQKTVVPISEYDNPASTDAFIEALNNPDKVKNKGSDKLDDGTKVEVYEITLDSPEMLDSFLSGFNPSDLGLTDDDVKEIFKGIKMEFSIDPEEKVIRMVFVDIKDLMEDLFEKADLDVSVEKLEVTVEFHSYDNVNVTIPETVRNEAEN